MTKATKPRILETKIHPPLIKKEDLGKKIKKSTNPDVGSYEPTKGLNYTARKGFTQKMNTGPVIKFYESQVKLAKKVPSCSHYTVTDKAMN